MEQQIGRKLKNFTDYASKESLGQVHAGGFLHNHIRRNSDGSSTAPAQLSNAERKHRITEAWQHLISRPVDPGMQRSIRRNPGHRTAQRQVPDWAPLLTKMLPKICQIPGSAGSERWFERQQNLKSVALS